MAQGILPFKYEVEQNRSGMTSLAGLPIYLELFSLVGLAASIKQHVKARFNTQGWSDVQHIMSVILLNLAGGDCVDDLAILQGDHGFSQIMQHIKTHGMLRRERRELARRQRKENNRVVPSPSSTFRYLDEFHDPREEEKREPHKAFIPAPNEHLQGLAQVNAHLAAFAQRQSPQKHATLDQDATLIETHKSNALFCYKKYRAYQPLNTYWAEQGLMLHSEFRDGNVPAGFEQLRVFESALTAVPQGVESVALRSDSAGYQIELLKYCAEGKNQRFGVIDFAISCDVTAEFRQAALARDAQWKPLLRKKIREDKDGTIHSTFEDVGQEYAEVAFVPNWIACGRKDAPTYRFLAIREPLRELELPLNETPTLPFPTAEFEQKGRYKLFGVVTNRLNTPGDEVIEWHRKRCGNSEKAHAIMKDDFAGGQFPSADFGCNAAWWAIMLLAMNLQILMQRFLGPEWKGRRMKAVRLHIIALPGQVITHARQLIVRLSLSHPSNELLLKMRRNMLSFATGPSG